MNYGQAARNEAFTGASQAQLVQPAGPLTDRIQREFGEIANILSAAESDLNSLSLRLFGPVPEKGVPGNPANQPQSAEEAIGQAVAYAEATAYRVRALAAELNGRI